MKKGLIPFIEPPIEELRMLDYFAGQALNGILCDDEWVELLGKKQSTAQIVSERAYAFAESMIEERKKHHKIRENRMGERAKAWQDIDTLRRFNKRLRGMRERAKAWQDT